jgi:hypothetical protein
MHEFVHALSLVSAFKYLLLFPLPCPVLSKQIDHQPRLKYPNTTDRSQFTLSLIIFSAFLNPMCVRIAFSKHQYSQASMHLYWHSPGSHLAKWTIAKLVMALSTSEQCNRWVMEVTGDTLWTFGWNATVCAVRSPSVLRIARRLMAPANHLHE